MNFSLRKLESHVREADLLRAEELLDAAAVEPLREIDRHLWVTHVLDGTERREVEVKISPSRILAATCECDRFQDSRSCGHFVAVLLKLRQHLQNQKAEKRKKRGQKPGKARKLTTSVVLRNVEREELVDFVKDYARTHRNFAIALKARFASNVGSIDSREKFRQLLESTINMARRPDRSISKRGEQKVAKVLREMHEQALEALAEQHYAEALSIAQSTIERVTPILGKLTAETETLRDAVKTAFGLLRQLVSYELPPDLRQTLWNYLADEHTKLTYRSHRLDHHFFEQMLELAEDDDEIEQLQTAISRQTDRYLSEGRQPSTLRLLQLKSLEKAGRDQLAAEFIEKHLLQPKILREAVDQSIHNQEWYRARQLCLSGLEKFRDPNLRRALEYRLIDIAKAQGDEETLHSVLESQFLRELDLSIYRELLNYYQGNPAGFHQSLIEKVKEHSPPSPRQTDILAFLYGEAGQTTQLLEFLEDSQSLELLQRYDHYLIYQDKKGLLKLYHQLLTEYIQHHLGPKSSSKIRQTLHHLNEIGMGELATRLAEEFRSNYPERHTLMEELALF